MLDIWGSRTALFESQRDRSLQKLRTTYRGEEYAFGDRLRFAYADFGEGESWTASKSHSGSVRRMRRPDGRAVYVRVRLPGRSGGSRGWPGLPEAIQVADSEAVLTGSDRDRLIRMLLRQAKILRFRLSGTPKIGASVVADDRNNLSRRPSHEQSNTISHTTR